MKSLSIKNMGGVTIVLLGVAVALLVSGCNQLEGEQGLPGADSATAEDGLPGTDGVPGDPGPTGAPFPGVLPAVITCSIEGVTIASKPVVRFSLRDQNGNPFAFLPANRIRFTIAKLVEFDNGEPSYWQSYINRVETVDADGPGNPGDTAIQANYETATAGTLTNHNDGSYSYEFSFDVASVTSPISVSYEPGLTHRVALQISGGGLPIENGTFNFRPSDGATTGLYSRSIVKNESCNECHGELRLHGSRTQVDYCVTCHNPGTVDANTGNIVDFKVMIHKIHRGKNLPSVVSGGSYAIVGYRDNTHDYSELGYPQDIRSCNKCHDPADSETPDAANWQNVASVEACGSCHDDKDFSGSPGPGQVGHTGGNPMPNTLCVFCHTSGGFADTVAASHGFPERVADEAAKFSYNIDSLSYSAPDLTIVYYVSDPTNSDAKYDLTDALGPMVAGNRLTVALGWDTSDYTNEGSLGKPSRALELNGLDIGAGLTATDNGDGTYTIVTTLPAEAQAAGTVAVMINGHPNVDVVTDVYPLTTASTQIPVPNEIAYVAINDATKQPRRDVVDVDKCKNCHGTLTLHGSGQTDRTDACVICHNPNNTDIYRRPVTAFNEGVVPGVETTDGKKEESIDFKTMIHAIHAAGKRDDPLVIYGYAFPPAENSGTEHVFSKSEVHFPGILNNCETCHLPGTYTVPLVSDVLPNTVNTDPAATTPADDNDSTLLLPADDFNVTATAAVCSSCHDNFLAKMHMDQNGADFGVLDIAVGMSSDNTEVCAVCHGEGRLVDVEVMHDMQ